MHVISLYEWLKALHILGASLLVAYSIVAMILIPIKRQMQAASQLPAVYRAERVALYHLLFLLAIFMPATGLWMAHIATFDLEEIWLSLSIAIVVFLTIMMIVTLYQAQNHTPPSLLPPLKDKSIFFALMLGLLVVIIAMMVWKVE